MNILFICDEYPPGRNGGIGTMVQVLSRELVRQGHKVFVAGLYGYRYGGADHENDKGVQVYRLRYGLNLPVNGNSRWYNLMEKLPRFLQRSLNGKKAFNRYITFLKELIDKENIEVIEIADWNVFTFFIGFKVEWPEFKAPLIVKSNGSYTYFNTELKQPLKEEMHSVDLALYKRADALSAVSVYTANANKKLFQIQRRVEILYNSIELPEIEITGKREEQKIVYTGTLIAKKGIFQLMKAWNLVNRRLPKAELLVFGKGNIKALKNLLDEKALPTVHFMGHVSRPELFRVMSTATASIFPSYSECFALAPLEAMIVGSPLIYSTRSSGPELIEDGKNGLLIDPDNIEGIAAGIIRVIESKSLQQAYSEKGRQTILDKFNIAKSAQDHIAYYSRVIAEFKHTKHRK